MPLVDGVHGDGWAWRRRRLMGLPRQGRALMEVRKLAKLGWGRSERGRGRGDPDGGAPPAALGATWPVWGP